MVILSDKQISSVVDRLNKCGVAACPVCGRKELKVSDKVFALSEYLPEGFFPIPLRGDQPLRTTESSQVFPVVPVVCSTCGSVFFLSAMALNIVSLQKGGT
jgi:hypothetical protein